MKANEINLSISDAREDDMFIISYTFIFFKNKKTNLRICLTKENKLVLYLRITTFIDS